MISTVIRALAGGAVLLAMTAGALGQLTPQEAAENKAQVSEADFQRQMDQFQYNSRIHVNNDIPPDQRLLLDYGGYVTFDYLTVTDPINNTHVLRDTALVVYGRANLDNAQEVFVRTKVNYNDYNSNNSSGPPDDFGGGIEGPGQHTSVEEAYYRFDLRGFLGAYDGIVTNNDASAELGRQTVIWGNGLVFNQDIDGGVMDLSYSGLNLEGVAGVSVPDTIDFDTSRPGFNDRTTRGFFGALLSYQIDRHRPYAYFLSERDFNSARPLVTTVGANTITTDYDYNPDYIGLGSTGSVTDHLAYGLEGSVETGSGLGNSYTLVGGVPTQANQKYQAILASAGDFRLDYLFTDPHDTRLSAEYIVASGDTDRSLTNTTFGGPKIGTKDLAFNGFGLLNTGLAFAPDVSNVMIERMGLSTQPLNQYQWFRKAELGTDIFIFEKTLKDAPIDEPTSGSGGVPGSAQQYLGWEPDFYLNWQITSDFTLAMRYGLFFPGNTDFEAEKALGADKVRSLFYTGVTYAF